MKIDNLDYKKQFFITLTERQRRHFAAIEAKQLGHGGIKEVSEQLGISVVTIRQGILELEAQEVLPDGRVRKEGGGRKKNC